VAYPRLGTHPVRLAPRSAQPRRLRPHPDVQIPIAGHTGGPAMEFDSRDEAWTLAQERETHARSPWALAIALALIALTTAALIAAPTVEHKPRPAVAGTLH